MPVIVRLHLGKSLPPLLWELGIQVLVAVGEQQLKVAGFVEEVQALLLAVVEELFDLLVTLK
jgi:hypothetical protein